MAHSETSNNGSIKKAETMVSNNEIKQCFVQEITPYYNLVKPKGTKPTMVYFIVRIKKEQVRISTRCKVYPNQWEKNKAKVSKLLPKLESDNNMILNNQIKIYNQRFDEYKYLVNCGQIEMNKDTLKHYIYKGQIMKEIKEALNIPQTLKKYIYNDISFTDATRENRIREVEKFESFLNGRVLNSYSELNTKLFREFQEWLIENVEGKNEDGTASPATLNKIVSNLLGSINKYLVANEIISKSQFIDIVVTPIKQTKNDNKIALTEDEIYLLHNYQCETEKDEQIRDLFLLECTTGQRFSDVNKVTNNIIHKDGRTYINLVQDKNKAPIQVDILFEMALEIVQKYDYKLPNISNKLLNERIKIIAQKAGIKGSEELFFDHIDKSKAYTITRERYECVCSHTGRNTFVTMLSLRGWHYHEIGRYTGHKKIETIQHYDKSKVGTKYRVMFEALQKERPELLLKLVTDKVNKETSKEPNNLSTNSLLNDNVKVKPEYYAINSITFDILLDTQFFASKINKAVELQSQVGHLKDGKLCSYDNEIASLISEIEKLSQSSTSDSDVAKQYVKQLSVWKLSDLHDCFRKMIIKCVEIGISRDAIMQFINKALEIGLLDNERFINIKEITTALLDKRNQD
ncbi:tyrosine-type recombinase/integrase [Bacteroides uniformis]|uniref:Tyrosine-type recombinase/integrase n=1 Tax=Bacteroides uniformis TaxID=820 RepID=A0AAW6GTG5_BACUN|nr:tyrosine-type recombinase/integrase [Bacteroides uniformis]MDC1881268.1 tyrosine-type recombinase/integrase [Bacteroides uniformis]MDC1885288.1 tyrosine-type recombinase/integrase [Bacteroides uniformis]